jgi:hypothetical protein
LRPPWQVPRRPPQLEIQLSQGLLIQPLSSRSKGSRPYGPISGSKLRYQQKSDGKTRPVNRQRVEVQMHRIVKTNAIHDDIKTVYKDNLIHMPNLGRGGSDVWEFIRMTSSNFALNRKRALPFLRQYKRSIAWASALQSLMIGTIIEVKWIDAQLAGYLALHNSGLAVICRKPPLRLLKLLVTLLMHCRSTLLTPNGIVRLITASESSFDLSIHNWMRTSRCKNDPCLRADQFTDLGPGLFGGMPVGCTMRLVRVGRPANLLDF